MKARRVRARQKGVKGYVNAMRPTWLGNPYTLDEYSLKDSLFHYEAMIRRTLDYDKDWAKHFDSLWGRNIGCTCPLDQDCHVDIIIKLLEERNCSIV